MGVDPRNEGEERDWTEVRWNRREVLRCRSSLAMTSGCFEGGAWPESEFYQFHHSRHEGTTVGTPSNTK
jgi:hypothetical protein